MGHNTNTKAGTSVCSAPGWWCLLVMLPSEDGAETGERGSVE
jgi:hypothetical protein